MSIEEYRKGLVCLVPNPGSDSVITSHEKTLCDCQVLEIFTAYDELQSENAKLQLMAENYRSKLAEIAAPQYGLEMHDSLEYQLSYWEQQTERCRKIAREALEKK